MKVSAISCRSMCYPPNVHKTNNSYAHSEQIQQPSFKGVKGAAIGAGAGLVWGALILGACAVAAPYLIPAMATDVLLGGAGAGAIAGHNIENECKK